MTKPKEKDQKPTEAENQGNPTEDQNQGVVFDDGEETVVETQTETPEEKEIQTPPEKKETEDKEDDSEDKIQKKFDKLTWKRREAEEKAEEAEARARKAEERIAELEGKNKDIEIPPVPDVMDADYDAKLKQREDALMKQAELNAQRKLAEQAQADAVEAQRQEFLKNIETNHKNMYKSAKEIGFKEEDFEQADLKVTRFLRHIPDVATFILEQQDSPLIVQYLATNMESLEKVSRMSPIHAAAYIAGEVAPKAQSLKPEPTKTPEPLDLVQGKGGGEDESPYLEGVDFE